MSKNALSENVLNKSAWCKNVHTQNESASELNKNSQNEKGENSRRLKYSSKN